MDYHFTEDYVSMHEKTWKEFLSPYIGNSNVHFLEIGSYEGRSTLWFLENILTHETSRITCVDNRYLENFYLNIAKFWNKVHVLSGDSNNVLRDKEFLKPTYDVIYIDGSHAAPDVLQDAVLTLPSLKVGGIMIFDDYLWKNPSTDYNVTEFSKEQLLRQEPKIAIDAFLGVFGDLVEIVFKKYQVICKKIKQHCE